MSVLDTTFTLASARESARSRSPTSSSSTGPPRLETRRAAARGDDPSPTARHGHGLPRVRHPRGDFRCGVAVACRADESGAVADCRIAACGSPPPAAAGRPESRVPRFHVGHRDARRGRVLARAEWTPPPTSRQRPLSRADRVLVKRALVERRVRQQGAGRPVMSDSDQPGHRITVTVNRVRMSRCGEPAHPGRLPPRALRLTGTTWAASRSLWGVHGDRGRAAVRSCLMLATQADARDRDRGGLARNGQLNPLQTRSRTNHACSAGSAPRAS